MDEQHLEQFHCLGCDEPHALREDGAVVFGMVYRLNGRNRTMRQLAEALGHYEQSHPELHVFPDGDSHLILGLGEDYQREYATA